MSLPHDKHLQPAECGHIHYLRHAVLNALGLTKEDNARGKTVDDAWHLSDEFITEMKKDAGALIDRHAEINQDVEAIDGHLKALALMRVCERISKLDPQAGEVLRVLALDAMMEDISDRVQAEQDEGLLTGTGKLH